MNKISYHVMMFCVAPSDALTHPANSPDGLNPFSIIHSVFARQAYLEYGKALSFFILLYHGSIHNKFNVKKFIVFTHG